MAVTAGSTSEPRPITHRQIVSRLRRVGEARARGEVVRAVVRGGARVGVVEGGRARLHAAHQFRQEKTLVGEDEAVGREPARGGVARPRRGVRNTRPRPSRRTTGEETREPTRAPEARGARRREGSIAGGRRRGVARARAEATATSARACPGTLRQMAPKPTPAIHRRRRRPRSSELDGRFRVRARVSFRRAGRGSLARSSQPVQRQIPRRRCMLVVRFPLGRTRGRAPLEPHDRRRGHAPFAAVSVVGERHDPREVRVRAGRHHLAHPDGEVSARSPLQGGMPGEARVLRGAVLLSGGVGGFRPDRGGGGGGGGGWCCVTTIS